MECLLAVFLADQWCAFLYRLPCDECDLHHCQLENSTWHVVPACCLVVHCGLAMFCAYPAQGLQYGSTHADRVFIVRIFFAFYY